MNQNKLIIFLTLLLQLKINFCKTSYTIMLDPAGDAAEPGRVIDETYERGLTLQFAQALKKELESDKSIRVILSRFPGESIEPLQNASFANRLNVDLFVSLHFYQKTSNHLQDTQPAISLYHLLYHPVTDFWQSAKKDKLEFIPYDEIYKVSLNESTKAVQIAKKLLETTFIKNSIFTVGCPFKPLLGVVAPAFAIEIGLTDKNSWQDFVKPISLSLNHVYKQLYKTEVTK